MKRIGLRELTMHTLIAFTFRICFRLGPFVLAFSFAFAFPGLAHASLPESSNAPGGVAVIPLGSVSAGAISVHMGV